MLQNFANYAQIMLHMYASILHKFNISFLLSYFNHKTMSISSHYLFSNYVLCIYS